MRISDGQKRGGARGVEISKQVLALSPRQRFELQKYRLALLTTRPSHYRQKLLTQRTKFIPDIFSFIHDIYIAPLQETYSEALPVQLRPKGNVLIKNLAEERYIVPGQQAQRKREFIPSGESNELSARDRKAVQL